ncbi:MAG: hypothetical protein ACQEXB_01085 [Bacillota bacterium]
MFVAYLFAIAYTLGSVWASQAIVKGCERADDEFLKSDQAN